MYTALLTAMVLWISANFDFPANYEHPNIKLVPASEIAFLAIAPSRRPSSASS